MLASVFNLHFAGLVLHFVLLTFEFDLFPHGTSMKNLFDFSLEKKINR